MVSLSPGITEMVCAVGGESMLVGRTDACDYPASVVTTVPIVGSFGRPSLEQVVTQAPTVVLDSSLADHALADQMQALGLNRKRIRCKTLNDIASGMETIASILGTETTATPVIRAFKEHLTALRKTARAPISNAPKVYIELSHKPLITLGKTSFVTELVRLAGGRNIAADVDRDYFQVSPEWVVSQNPDIILCFTMSKRPGNARARVLKRPGWQQVNAVRNGAVYDDFDHDTALRPSPRTLNAVDSLRAYIRKGTP